MLDVHSLFFGQISQWPEHGTKIFFIPTNLIHYKQQWISVMEYSIKYPYLSIFNYRGTRRTSPRLQHKLQWTPNHCEITTVYDDDSQSYNTVVRWEIFKLVIVPNKPVLDNPHSRSLVQCSHSEETGRFYPQDRQVTN